MLIFTISGKNISKVTNYKINEIPTTIILINKQRYKVVSGIFHHGNTIYLGHYTNMLCQGNNWIKVSDLSFCKKSWPRGAKDAYILFLERI